jgi:hypothetical protein
MVHKAQIQRIEAQPKPVRAMLCAEDINECLSPKMIAAAKTHIMPPTQMKPRPPPIITRANTKKCAPTMNATAGMM